MSEEKYFTTELENHKFCIFGLQGSGKTVLAKHLMRKNKGWIAYDTTGDFKGLHRYCPENSTSVEELENFIRFVMRKNGKIKGLIIDEADNYFPSNGRILPYASELITKHRHYGLSVGFLTRRPQDMHAKIVESSKTLFSFYQEGVNALKRLDDISAGLGDAVRNLDYTKHEFIIKPVMGEPIKHPAIPPK